MELVQCLSTFLWPLLVLSFHLPGALTIRLFKIEVPAHCKVGDDAELTCKFDMQGEPLYSVKWYKDDMEFYRFVPKDTPQLQVFPRDGIHVDTTQSTRQKVLLRNVTRDTSGNFKCEVSAEAPSFKTKAKDQYMEVVVTPSNAAITGAHPKYRVGDLVNVTCFSYNSKPPASLKWKVNGNEVTETLFKPYGNDFSRRDSLNRRNNHHINKKKTNPHMQPDSYSYNMLDAQLHDYTPTEEEGQLSTSALGLSFTVQKQHIHKGLQLECILSIGSVHWQHIRETIPVTAREQPSKPGTWFRSTSGAYKNSPGLLPMVFAFTLLVFVRPTLPSPFMEPRG